VTTSPVSFTLEEVSDILVGTFAQGGTLRDLFIALSAPPPAIITGSDLRAVLDTYALRGAFDELLQNPQVLEALDTVWSGTRDGRPTLLFHFARPQSFTQATPVGPVKVNLGRTLTFTLDEQGNAALQPGDITMRWLLVRENLLVQLRRVTNDDGQIQDVVQLSAGHIVSQRYPLSVFTLPAALAPVVTATPVPVPLPAEAPAPPATQPAQGEILPAPVTTIESVSAAVAVVHQTRGRLRLRIGGLYRNQRCKMQLEQELRRQSGIRHVSANVLTGNLLVVYDVLLTPDAIQQWISHILLGKTLLLAGQLGQPGEPWHLLEPTAIVDLLESSLDAGLAPAVATARLRACGPNALPEPQHRSGFSIFAEQLQSLPVALLGASALLSVLTGGVADGAVILGVVLINASLGYATEQWAEQTIAGLSRGLRPTALVIRDGREAEIPGEQLVPGDLIVLKRGMYVPADARLLATEDLTIDESPLTGESIPIAKDSALLTAREIPLGSRRNMVYRGTVVTGGSGYALVVATGVATEVGQIQRMLTETEHPETPLQRQLRVLGGQLALLSLAICGGVFVLGILRGRGLLQMLKTAVSLAVAAVPEGLPTVATTTLALGLRRLEQQQVLVRRLVAVETLGALQYVCLDKTGTITLNRMTLVTVFTGAVVYQRRSAGFQCDEQAVDPQCTPDLFELLRLTALCSEVELIQEDDRTLLKGTPTESALVQAAMDAGVDVVNLRRQFPLRRMRLRSEQRIFMDTLHDDRANGNPGILLAVKGEPNQVLSLCNRHLCQGEILPLTEADYTRIITENERMAGRALRVLGIAYGHGEGLPEQEHKLIWVGLAGIADPPREGMPALMDQFHQAGIRTVMITGDQSATAYAIAKQIGLSHDGTFESLDATRLESLPPDVLRSLAQRVNLFSRVSPAHKLQIVQALQKAGHVVAMTGDGINDGPALRAADIGIAMGKEGSDVAQEVADIVVRDDNLATIIAAIEQGRTIYDDIKKAIHFILASNTSEILITLTATAVGLGEPLNPMQLLWINLITDIFPELALGLEPPESDIMQRLPRDPQAPMFTRTDIRRIGMEGVLITASAMTAYSWGLARYGMGPAAGTLAFTSLTGAQLLYAISCRSEPHSIFSAHRFPHNPYIPLAVGGGLALQGLATVTPLLRSMLGITPLGLTDWAVAAATAVTPLFVREVAKLSQVHEGNRQ